jgi:hypothetical protein
MQVCEILLDHAYRGYYYRTVNKKTRHILNWMLVALMVMLPLRNVSALEQVNCQMHDQSSIEMNEHGMHGMHGVSDIADADTDANEQHNCCCCDSGMNCNGNCSLGPAVSFIMQPAITVPLINGTAFHSCINSPLVLTEFSPPLRPPINL